MATMVHRFINSRDDFFKVLADALQQAKKFEAMYPEYIYTSVRRQLEAMTEWTTDGAEPSKDERVSITMGVQLIRELEEPATLEVEEWKERLQALTFYFKHWASDQDWKALDDEILETYLPDKYAP